jgi:hypothetical protein
MTKGTATIDLTVSDITRQKKRQVENVSPQATAAEVVQELIDELNMPRNDSAGRSLSYRALHRREARHLRPTERIGDNVRSGDLLILQPEVNAG